MTRLAAVGDNSCGFRPGKLLGTRWIVPGHGSRERREVEDEGSLDILLAKKNYDDWMACKGNKLQHNSIYALLE